MGENTGKLDRETDITSNLTPALKWAGGKRWLIPYLIPVYKKYRKRRLVEPFVGGMAVALGLSPERALLNDLNPHLINFYKNLKAGLLIELRMKNEREYFFAQREKFNLLVSKGLYKSKEAAEIFYYMNRTAFNGLCRFNSKGEYNVPFGRYLKINYQKDFSDYKLALKKWVFQCTDFENLKIQKDDFIYADPPYDVQFTKYSREDFRWEDQIRLVEWLSQFKNPIVVSNQATDRILKLYKKAGFNISKLSAPRRISCTGDRTNAQEMLATKNL